MNPAGPRKANMSGVQQNITKCCDKLKTRSSQNAKKPKCFDLNPAKYKTMRRSNIQIQFIKQAYPCL